MMYTGSINTEFEQLRDFEDYEIRLVDGYAIIRRIENQLYVDYKFYGGSYNIYAVELNNKLYDLDIIIAKHYIEHDSKYDIVDHVDKNKLNYNITNLRWVPNLHTILAQDVKPYPKYRKYTDGLPPGAVALSHYNYHPLKKDVVYCNGAFYYKGDESNKLPMFRTKNGGHYAQAEDNHHKKVCIYLDKDDKIKFWE